MQKRNNKSFIFLLAIFLLNSCDIYNNSNELINFSIEEFKKNKSKYFQVYTLLNGLGCLQNDTCVIYKTRSAEDAIFLCGNSTNHCPELTKKQNHEIYKILFDLDIVTLESRPGLLEFETKCRNGKLYKLWIVNCAFPEKVFSIHRDSIYSEDNLPHKEKTSFIYKLAGNWYAVVHPDSLPYSIAHAGARPTSLPYPE
jgi:predicted secreted protein